MSAVLRALRRAASTLSFRKRKKKRPKSKEKNSNTFTTEESVQAVTTGQLSTKSVTCPDEAGPLTVDVHVDETDTAETKNMDTGKQSLPETEPREVSETSTASVSDNSDTGSDSTEKTPSKWKFRKKVKEKILRKQFDECDPEVCVDILKTPSVQAFGALKKKLRSTDKSWAQGFLDCDGLNVLLDCVDMLGSKRVTQLSDALLLLECVSCVTKLVNSKMGLLYLVQHGSYTKKLVKALDTNNVMVKKQVFELLSALCVYSNEGYKLTMDALESFKTLKKQRYRFSLIVNELRMAELVPYKTTLMAFVNCIMVANEDLDDRIRVRNEFIGLNILDLINNLRNEDDEDLIIQCDVFDDEKESDDEELSALNPACVDINDHKEVFSALYNKVYNTPMADVFLTVLQTLLQIEPDNPFSDVQWSMVEASVRRASLIDESSSNKAALTNNIPKQQIASKSVQTDPKLTRLSSSDANQTLENKTKNDTSNEFKKALETQLSRGANGNSRPSTDTLKRIDKEIDNCFDFIGENNVETVSSPETPEKTVVPPAPPPPPLSGMVPPPPPPPPPPPSGVVPAPRPPPPLPSGMVPPPPPPPPPGCIPIPPPPPPPPGSIPIPPPPPPPGSVPIPPPPPPPPGSAPIPPPPPPPPGCGPMPPPPPPPPPSGTVPVPPSPCSKSRPAPLTFSSAPLLKSQSMWTPTPKHKMKTFNWTKVPPHTISSHENVWKEILDMQDSISVKYDAIEQLFCQKQIQKAAASEQKKKKPPSEILLLDTKRSMNVNIFLKQFKCSHSEIISMIEAGNIEVIGPERLRGLQKILPEADEISLIKDFHGDKEKLGNAEKFYLKLIELKSFRIRIEGLVLQDEFRLNMETLLPNIMTCVRACRNLLENESLKVFLRFVLHAGNFLNAGGYAGNAMGFKINSLNKLMDTRANKPRVTLLHYLVGEAEKESKDALAFASEMSPDLSAASRFSTDVLTTEVKQVKAALAKLSKQLANCPDDVQNQMKTFLQESESDVQKLDKGLEDIDSMIKQLINYFCENEKSFKVEECICNMNTFCEKVKQCQKENLQRQQQEEKAERRKKAQQEMAAQRSKHGPSPEPEEDGCIIDKLLNDIRKGYKLRKATPSQSPNKHDSDRKNVANKSATNAVQKSKETHGQPSTDETKTSSKVTVTNSSDSKVTDVSNSPGDDSRGKDESIVAETNFIMNGNHTENNENRHVVHVPVNDSQA